MSSTLEAAAPVDDTARLRALSRYAVLDTAPEQPFDDLALLAAVVTGCPVGGVGFVTEDRVWFKSLLGLDPDAALDVPCALGLGGPDVVVVPDVSRDSRLAGTALAEEAGITFYAGTPLMTSDGYVLGSLVVMDTEPRTLDRTQLGALQGLARQVVALLELRRTQMFFHTAIDGGGHVVFHVDGEGRLVSVTPTWAHLTGYGAVRSLSRPLLDFVHPEDRDDVTVHLARVGNDLSALKLECRIVGLTGAEVPVELSAHTLPGQLSGTDGLVGVLSDISGRKAVEVEVQHAQKLEALGRLSAGIAHEINTPIQFVGDNTRFLAEAYQTMLQLLLTYRSVLDVNAGALPWQERQKIVTDAELAADVDYLAEEVPTAVEQSLEGVERVASIIKAMKTFGHPGQETQAPADLNENLRATLTVAHSQLKYVADVTLDLGDDIPQVVCHASDLNQVFLNMVVNAAHAVEDKGELGKIRVSTRRDGDDHVAVEFSDTGGGIPEDIRMKIFEPFFTTKEVGRGTGQGLALARAVVQDRHQGTIALSSEVGVGTTFTIRLPVAGVPTFPTEESA